MNDHMPISRMEMLQLLADWISDVHQEIDDVRWWQVLRRGRLENLSASLLSYHLHVLRQTDDEYRTEVAETLKQFGIVWPQEAS